MEGAFHWFYPQRRSEIKHTDPDHHTLASPYRTPDTSWLFWSFKAKALILKPETAPTSRVLLGLNVDAWRMLNKLQTRTKMLKKNSFRRLTLLWPRPCLDRFWNRIRSPAGYDDRSIYLTNIQQFVLAISCWRWETNRRRTRKRKERRRKWWKVKKLLLCPPESLISAIFHERVAERL